VEKLAVLEIILSIVASVMAGMILHYILSFPPHSIIAICLLIILFAMSFDQHIRIRNLYFHVKNLEERINIIESHLNAVVSIIKVIIDALMGIRERLSRLPREKTITVGDIADILDEATSTISGKVREAYFKTLTTKSSNHEDRKRELLERAERREISYEEYRELKMLLEKQKKDCEETGNMIGAIMAGLLILFVMGVLASLSSKKNEQK